MEIAVMEVAWEEGGAVVTGIIGASVSPLPGDGLDEALGLAIGLRAIRSGETMLDAELLASGGEEFGAIGGVPIGEEALDDDAVVLVESEGLVEGVQSAGDFFIREQAGESQAGMVVDGDVEGFDAGARIAMGTIASGADAGLKKTAKLFNIKMKQLAGGGAFITQDRRLGRIEGCQAVEAMALEDAGKGSFGDGKNHEDLSVGTALTAESEDLGFEFWRSLARLAVWSGRMVWQAEWEALSSSASEPTADGFIADAEGSGGSAERAVELGMVPRHLGSR